MTKIFRVLSISTKPNSFGLHGHVLVSQDGTAFEVGRNRGPHLTPWNINDDVSVSYDGACLAPIWAAHSCEIPRQLPNCPANVLKEIFGQHTFVCEFTWSTPSGTGQSSYTIVGVKDAAEARKRARTAFDRDFAGYTFGEFGTCRPV